jgi:hypothetical protein
VASNHFATRINLRFVCLAFVYADSRAQKAFSPADLLGDPVLIVNAFQTVQTQSSVYLNRCHILQELGKVIIIVLRALCFTERLFKWVNNSLGHHNRL